MALVDPGTDAARVDLIRQYGRAQNTVFPKGAYHKGGSYESDVNSPVPPSEENNPNFHGCIDRKA